MKLLHYGVRLRKEQLEYLRTKDKPSAWVRKAIDEQMKKEES